MNVRPRPATLRDPARRRLARRLTHLPVREPRRVCIFIELHGRRRVLRRYWNARAASHEYEGVKRLAFGLARRAGVDISAAGVALVRPIPSSKKL